MRALIGIGIMVWLVASAVAIMAMVVAWEGERRRENQRRFVRGYYFKRGKVDLLGRMLS